MTTQPTTRLQRAAIFAREMAGSLAEIGSPDRAEWWQGETARLDIMAAAEALGSQTQPPLPMDLMSAPMDLSAFEANVTASGILHATPVQQLGQAPAAPVANPAAAADDGALWSVFMGKNTNPRVHQVVAELQGISVAEAARLCQKPVVSLAKDVSGTVAREIRQRMVAVSAQVRLTKRG
jgi:ribosomal protein L7/L12